jgi:PAS domain S-box-containing protein
VTPLAVLLTLAGAHVLASAWSFAWPVGLTVSVALLVAGVTRTLHALRDSHALFNAALQPVRDARIASERRLALAMRGGHKGLWESDVAARTTWHSPGFHERLGLEPQAYDCDLDWFAARVHPEDHARWSEAVVLQRTKGETIDLEVRLLTISGEHRAFRVRADVTWDGAARPRTVSGALSEVSEYRYAEQRLRESEESFRSLSAASPVGIVKADAAGRCVYVNERWQTLASLSEFEAMEDGWLETVAPEDHARVLQRWLDFTSGGKSFDDEFRYVVSGGGYRWVRSRANAVLDELCAIAGYVVTFEDVTEARVAAEALADARDKAMQAAKAKSEFLANMSHEIRTPLNGVVGMTELLMGTRLDDEQRDFLRTINMSADALLSIINDILDFSKIEAGKMTIERVPMDVRELTEDVGDLVLPRIREQGLELLLAVDENVPRHVIGDPTRVRQILINLVSNAIKFTEQGEVVVGAGVLDAAGGSPRLKIWVRDTGIGIPEERLGAVFESFTQADGSTTRKYGGTGLGLTICRQLATLMGGSIHVASETGAGSEFWIELPLEVAQGAAPDYEIVCDLSGMRVLVVDDHPLNRRILVERMRSWGARPVSAADGEEALKAIRLEGGDPFQVVLLDHRMPGLTGSEVAERLRDMPGADGRVVIMVSSMGSIADTEERQRIGVDAWLTKPVREASLHRTLCQTLGKAPSPSKAAVEPAHEEDFAGLQLLLVEDNEVNRKVALRMLQKAGARADVAVNGREAVQRVSERSYDCVFMDCQMPEMDGFEATREIRRREESTAEHVFIVAMTANAMEGDRERCLESGMDDYVSKPVKQERVLEQLRAALARRQQREAA